MTGLATELKFLFLYFFMSFLQKNCMCVWVALSSKFGVSKSLDSFIIFPDRLLGISAVDAKNGLLKNP
jgi:hypothetical protein